jgi:hypothetical protein
MIDTISQSCTIAAFVKNSLRPSILAIGVGIALTLASTLAADAQEASKPFTLSYSAAYLTDPFQAVGVNLTMDSAILGGVR